MPALPGPLPASAGRAGLGGGQTKSAYSPGRDSPDRGGRWLSRLVFPWAFISKICLPYSSIFIYFLDIAKPPRVVLLSYTGRLFVYCLLFTDRFRLSFRRAYYICLTFFSLSITKEVFLNFSSLIFIISPQKLALVYHKKTCFSSLLIFNSSSYHIICK